MTTMANRPRMSRGFTLVEILVALVLGFFLLAGVVQIFTSNQHASRLINSYGQQQEYARVATGLLSQSLRLAGHFGGINSAAVVVDDSVSISGRGGCNKTWLTNTSEAIRAYDGAASIADVEDFPANCIPSSHYVANTDIVVMRYADSVSMVSNGEINDAQDSFFVRTIIGNKSLESGAEIFKGSAGPTHGGLGETLPNGVYNYAFRSEVYFIRPCAVVVADECDDGIPTLVKLHVVDGELIEEPLIEHVEQFQLDFGIDTDADLSPDTYLPPGAINGNQWRRLLNARFSLVVRSDRGDKTFADSKSYTLAGEYTYTPADDVDHYVRKVYTKAVGLRNITRS